MKFLKVATVSAVGLRGQPPLSTLEDAQTLQQEHAKFVDRLLDDDVPVTEMKQMVDTATADIKDYSKLELPPTISTLLKKDEPGLDDAAVKKAVKNLNDMMSNSQIELDEKIVECKGQRTSLKTLINQATTDVARLASVITNLGRQELESQAKIQELNDSLELLGEEAETKKKDYEKARKLDMDQLDLHKKDLAVAEYILNVSKCPAADGKKSFLQLMNVPDVTDVEHCEDDDGSDATAEFVDKKLHSMVTSLATVEARNQVSRLLIEGQVADIVEAKATDDALTADVAETEAEAETADKESAEAEMEEGDEMDAEMDAEMAKKGISYKANCAKEGKTCECTGTVRYGVGKNWALRYSNGSIGCNNGVFGDPKRGKKKTCECAAGVKLECYYMPGFGKGKRSAYLGKVKGKEKCRQKVKKEEPSANGVSYGVKGLLRKKKCYAIFDADGLDTKKKRNKKWQSCIWKKPQVPPVDAAKPPEQSSQPASVRKQAKKCRVARVDCGLLHDNMSLLWGDYKDEVEEMEAKIARNDARYTKDKQNFAERKGMLVTGVNTANAGLAEARSTTSSMKQEQSGTEKEHRTLTKKLNAVNLDCRTTTQHILFNKFCGLRSVRGALLAKSKPDLIVADCQVGNWVVGSCSKACDDTKPEDPSQYGGWAEVKREIVDKNTEMWGQSCPALSMNMRCGQFPCPKNCEMSSWSGWSACTAECGGGVQNRSRSITQEPSNGGTKCNSTTESQACNSGSCDRDCTLNKWTSRPCSMACGGGLIVERAAIDVPKRGAGKCPKEISALRYKEEKCNVQPCKGDEICIAKQDTVIALDGSGSVREKGFKVLKDFAASLIKQMKSKVGKKLKGKKGKKKKTAVRVGVVQFGNGVLSPDGTVSGAEIVSKLNLKIGKTAKKVKELKWQRGFTNLAQAFTAANTIFMDGRKKAQSVIVVITDGRPSFLRSTDAMIKQARQKGVKIVVAMVKAFPTRAMKTQFAKWVSKPAKSFLVHVPGLKALKNNMSLYVNEVLIRSCSKSISQRRRDSKKEKKKGLHIF